MEFYPGFEIAPKRKYTKREKAIFNLTSSAGVIEIYENKNYTWCNQHGKFLKEDDDIFAWIPGQNGTPSYFSQKDIQNISTNQGIPTISK
jgi:hypothetical protein